MKRLLFALLLIGLFCTCRKDPYANLCGGSDPIRNLKWLEAKINLLKNSPDHTTISRGEYQGQTVFFVQTACCPACSCIPFKGYNCDGNPISFPIGQPQDFINNYLLVNTQLLWSN